LWLTYWLTKPILRGKCNPDLWVVSGVETAANLYNTGKVLEPSMTVSFAPHPFYDFRYTYSLHGRTSPTTFLVRLVGGPVLLGILLHRAGSFFYVGGAGFLFQQLDGRAAEFRFVKGRGKRIVCSFLGTEIRSRHLLLEFAKERDLEVISSYDHLLAPKRLNDTWEEQRLRLARSADRYADEILNAPVDQMTYITRPVHPPIYFHPSEWFRRNDAKFDTIDRIKVVHAPSSPIIKGTPLVRAAVKKLRMEGYQFDYVELSGVPHAVVMDTLESAHIVLNEFYAFVPGQFGVEAMAAHCALLTSADEAIEPSLPPGSNQAWMVTPYWQIYDNLKLLLEDLSLIKGYADRGFEWAQAHCEYTAARRKLLSILERPSGSDA
jgi:hypothetical protein